MPEKNPELWAKYNEIFQRVAALDPRLAFDFDVAAGDLKTAEVDQARFEALNGATLRGQFLFHSESGSVGPDVTIHFVPAEAEVPA